MTLEDAKKAVMEKFSDTQEGQNYGRAIHSRVWKAAQAGLVVGGPKAPKDKGPAIGG